jgi:hypothetical protein
MSLPANCLITVTGVSAAPPSKFIREHPLDLGVPSQASTSSQTRFRDGMDTAADSDILAELPQLAGGPSTSSNSPYSLPLPIAASSTTGAKLASDTQSISPYWLQRNIASPGLTVKGDYSIAFIGYYGNIAATVRLETTSLWAYAYLSGKLEVGKGTVWRESAFMSHFHMYQSPFGHGRWYPGNVFGPEPFL